MKIKNGSQCKLTLENEASNYKLFIELELGTEIPNSLRDIILSIAREGSEQLSKEEIQLIEITFKQDIVELQAWEKVEVIKALTQSQIGIKIKAGPQLKFNRIFQLPKEFVNFTGRKAKIAELEINFQKSGVITQKLHGTGGIGKTQLASSYSQLKLIEGYYQWVVWFRVGEIDDSRKIINQFEDLGDRLGIDIKKYKGEKLIELVFLELSQRGQGLVVLDDVTDYIKIKMCLPKQYRYNDIHVLMTSRSALNWGPEISNVCLGVFEPEDAVLYIKKVIVKEKYDEVEARRLMYALGYFPLALTQGLAYINNNLITVCGYIEEFKRSKERQRELLDSLPFADDDHQITAYITIRMSREKINNVFARKLLDRCVYLIPESPIPDELLSRWIEDIGCRNTAITLLKQYSLLEDFNRDEFLKMHQTIQDVIKVDHKPADEKLFRKQIRDDISLVQKNYPRKTHNFESNNGFYNLNNHQLHLINSGFFEDCRQHIKANQDSRERIMKMFEDANEDLHSVLDSTIEHAKKAIDRTNKERENVIQDLRNSVENLKSSDPFLTDQNESDNERQYSEDWSDTSEKNSSNENGKVSIKCCSNSLYSFCSKLSSYFNSDNNNQNKALIKDKKQ